MRKYILCLLIIGTGLLIGSTVSAGIAPSPWKVELSFDKDYYEYGEPVVATVKVENVSGGPVYVSNGFSTKKFYLELRVIDPAGRLVLARRDEPHDEFPDAPPLPFCQKNDGTFTQVAPYEILGADWSTSITKDLRDYYPLKFPGNYSFQVQLSAMTWNPPQGDPCIGDINASHASVGVFKSETNYIRTVGSTEVDIYPEWWRIAWKTVPLDYVIVNIWPPEGKTVDDFRKTGIKLNNKVKAVSTTKKYSPVRLKHYLSVLFKRRAAINSLGNVQAGEWHDVVVSGSMKNNEFYGGGQKIKIIE